MTIVQCEYLTLNQLIYSLNFRLLIIMELLLILRDYGNIIMAC